VGGLRRSVSFLLNKELDGDTQITKQQQSFIQSESRKALPKEGQKRAPVRWLKSSTYASRAGCLGLEGNLYTIRGEQRGRSGRSGGAFGD
jgi:hypothetical protein